MKWIGNRITFVDNQDSVSFVIYPPKLGWKKHLVLAWFVLFFGIGVYISTRFFLDFSKEEKLVLFIFMAFWLYFTIRVFRTLLYLYFGREYIKLDKTSLRVKTATGEYGKAKQFFIENVSKFKMESLKDSSFQKVYDDSPWVKGTPRINFEYYEKKYSFGRKLENKDAEMLYKILTKRIEKFIRAKKK